MLTLQVKFYLQNLKVQQGTCLLPAPQKYTFTGFQNVCFQEVQRLQRNPILKSVEYAHVQCTL